MSFDLNNLLYYHVSMKIEKRAEQKKHLMGGSLHQAMVEEVRRVLGVYSGLKNQKDAAAVELGVTPRTLCKWLKNWPELNEMGSIETVLKATKVKKTRARKKTPEKKVG